MRPNKKITISVSLILLINGIAALGWFYLYLSISRHVREINEIRGKLAVTERDYSNGRSLKMFLDNFQDERRKIDEIFLNKETLIKFIEKLEEMSEKTGASLKFSSIRVDGESGAKKGLRLQFRLTGKFSEIYRYLSLLENLPHQIVFEKSYIQSGKEGWVADLEIILLTYIL